MASSQYTLKKKTILGIYASSGFGAIVGIIVSSIAGAFVYLVNTSNNVDLFGEYRVVNFGIFNLDLQVVALINLAALLILLVRYSFGIKKWNGPADSIYAAHQEADGLDTKTGFASFG